MRSPRGLDKTPDQPNVIDQQFRTRRWQGTGLVGSDSLRVTTELSIADLPQLLDEILKAYNSTAYRTNFGWIDNIQEADPALHPTLDGKLVTELSNDSGTVAYLAPADIIDWADIQKFNYTNGSPSDAGDDLSLDTYLGIVSRKGQTVTAERLKTHRVKILFSSERSFRDEWSIYDCLVWETTYKGKLYTLFDGRWFVVGQSFAKHVAHYVSRISSTALTCLVDAAPGEDEGPYNERVAKDHSARVAMLDRQTFKPTNGNSVIEFCDLLTDTGQLIHVKKRSSSATLSHLFSQCSVSADLFLNDPQLRGSVRKKLKSLGKSTHAVLIPIQGRPSPASFEIVYAVIAQPVRGAWPPSLPFFSAVNLMHHGSRIESLGFNLKLQYIRQR
ncbi:MAG: hypothetical protein EOP84_10890 [Verrucomicrobiaceae bacterium]|nr:MAG: hypothetical protein EOP84_10890 [Verrucomicrobiaceae bacterium]